MSKCVIEIDSVDMVFNYNYRATEITDHMCRICNNHLMEPILNKKNNTLDTRISLGKCGHSFHTTCVGNYHQKQQKIDKDFVKYACPIDQMEWAQKRILDNKNTFGKLILSDINYIENPSIHYRSEKK